jgi:hypothetical protein
MKKLSQQLTTLFISLIVLIFLSVNYAPGAFAGIEWDIQKTLTLDDTPLDVAYSIYGAKAYVLCIKSLLIYDLEGGKLSDKIPLEAEFSKIAVTPNQDLVYLTDVAGKKISVLSISNVYTIDIGNPPLLATKMQRYILLLSWIISVRIVHKFTPPLRKYLPNTRKRQTLLLNTTP